jgi:hypothetical protein
VPSPKRKGSRPEKIRCTLRTVKKTGGDAEYRNLYGIASDFKKIGEDIDPTVY